MNIIEAMEDPALFKDQFKGDSWDAWKALLAGFYGLPTDKTVYSDLTRRQPSDSELEELWLVIGRRGGKSNIAALLAVYEAIFNDHKDKLAAGEVATVMVIAADRKQARTVMRYIRGLLIENPMLSKLVMRDSSDSIELTNRCSIEIMTATHRGIRGYTVAAVILDEVAFWYSDGANPDSEILSALRPSMATLKGKLIALSSPYARRGILWRNFKRYFGADGRVLVAQAPTLTMNPLLDPQIVADAIAEDPISASAEYLAQFRNDIESFVSLEAVEACMRPSPREIPQCSTQWYTAFTDPSGGVADSFTLCIAHLEKSVVIIDLVRAIKPPFSPEAVVDEFCKILKEYRVRRVYGDSYAGEWPKEQFAKRGIEYTKASRNRSELYRDVLPLINSERLELPPDETLKMELVNLERRSTRGGRDSIDHAPGAHDDIANAVAGAAVTAVELLNYSPIKIKIGFAY